MNEPANNFNAIRLIAALTLIMGHAYKLAGATDPFHKLTGHSLGQTAILAFAAISGYLITLSYDRLTLIDFAASRALKLFPPLVANVLITVTALAAISNLAPAHYFFHEQTLRFLLGNASLLSPQSNLPGVFSSNHDPLANGALWLLRYQICAYGLFVIVLGKTEPKTRRRGYALGAVAAAILLLYATWLIPGPIIPEQAFDVSEMITPFLLGSIIASFDLKPSINALSLSFAIAAITHETALSGLSYAACIGILALGLARTPNIILRAISDAPDISYGLFLYAYPVEQIIIHFAPQAPPELIACGTVSITMIPAIASWRWIEKPAMALKSHFADITKKTPANKSELPQANLTETINNIDGDFLDKEPFDENDLCQFLGPDSEVPQKPIEAVAIELYDVKEIDKIIDSEGEDEPNSASQKNILLLQRLREKGSYGATRHLRVATPDMLNQLDAILASAPHMRAVVDAVKNRVALSINTATPFFLPPILLLGPPGVGKTWFFSRVAEALNLPLRKQAMTTMSIGETLTGHNASWQNAQSGLIAKTLLGEKIANPIVFVDEFDKASTHAFNSDPYRPFYTLLERETAANFTDEFLMFPLRADHINWIFTANRLDPFPELIQDRIEIIPMRPIEPDQAKTIIGSIYRDINSKYRDWFEPELNETVTTRLAELENLRISKRALEHAFASAGARNSRTLVLSDLPAKRSANYKMGFIH